MKRDLRGALRFVASLLVLLLCASSAWGQATTGSILGNVTDPSGGAVTEASAEATNQATGVSYPSETDQYGNFSILHVPPGKYTVKVMKAGFEITTITDLIIDIDQKPFLNVQLKVGAVNESVTVSASAVPLQTQSMETSEVINNRDIVDLPLLGRGFLDFTLLTTGVTDSNHNVSSFSISINGQRSYANSIMIDGVEATTNRSQDITVTPSVDAVEQFKLTTSAYAAEFGRAAGGVVAIQTKSGGNNIHGSAYEFFRPSFTAAKPFGWGKAVPNSNLHQHNFGGSLGGPIRKNKSFFFASYERKQLHDAYTELDATVPKQYINVLPDGSVDLSNLQDPGSPAGGPPIIIPIYNPFATGQLFPGNIIPANLVSKAGLNTLLDFFPAPNLPGTGNGWYGNFRVYSPVTYSGNIGDARYDHNFSDKDRLAVVYHYGDSNQLVTDPYHGQTVVPGAGDADQANSEVLRNQELSVTETHIFSTRVVNEARFGYTRLRESLYSLLNGHDYSTQYGAQNVGVSGIPATYGFPYIYMGTGYITGGSTWKPFLELDRNYQISDNATFSSIGKHEIKFGGDFRKLNSNPNFPLFPTGFQYYGSYGYSATSNPYAYVPGAYMWAGGNDIADLLLGIPYYDRIGLQITNPHTRSWEMAYFVQDTYRFSPKLTLYGGIRYEFQAPFKEANNGMSNYDPATDSLLLAGRGSNAAALVNSRWTNLGPRLGIAYQINAKTVIRTGYGFFYSPENDAREDILTKNYPFATQTLYDNTPGFYAFNYYSAGPYVYNLSTGIPRITTPQIPSGVTSIAAQNVPGGPAIVFYEDPHIKTGYAQSYNLTLQRELSNSFLLDVAYVGSVSHDLSYQIGNMNLRGGNAHYISQYLAQIQGLNSAGWADYNSLQIKVTKRASKNLNFLAAYTYGHSMDNGPAPFDLGHNGNNLPQDPYNLRAEVASGDYDIRHNFNFSGLYRLPIGKGQPLFDDWGTVHELLLGGWQINGILSLHTGTPFNIVTNGSSATCPGVRPNIVSNPHSNVPAGDVFNPAAFVAAGSGADACTFGDFGRNVLYGPGYANLDFSLFKEFPIKEWGKIQTRLEAFNTTNSPHFTNPNADMNGQSFAQTTYTYGNMRIVQLGVKFLF